jgi:class 3 adenylate cyclase
MLVRRSNTYLQSSPHALPFLSAVCGVPKENTKHAVVMAEFARETLSKFDNLVRGDLAMTLGPDTAELGLRVGLHTGPVTGK